MLRFGLGNGILAIADESKQQVGITRQKITLNPAGKIINMVNLYRHRAQFGTQIAGGTVADDPGGLVTLISGRRI